MAKEYIERDAALKLIREEGVNQAEQYANIHHLVVLAYGDCFGKIKSLPTADVVEVKHGEWIEKFKDGFWYYDCPFCDDGYVVMEKDENKPNYCGNCGAKMDGGKANDL